MEKKQYELCVEVLKRFYENGILSNIIIIGSWCLPFYKEYFKNFDYELAFRTRDIDFLIPSPTQIKKDVDIIDLLDDLGFIVKHSYPSGYMKLVHPDLIIEFLVQEKGKGSDKPFKLTQFGINAQRLRFLDLLSKNLISVDVEGIPISLPNPINFVLHKLIVAERRDDPLKAEKDRASAVQLIRVLIQSGHKAKIQELFDKLPRKWQKMILRSLEEEEEEELTIDFLKKSI